MHNPPAFPFKSMHRDGYEQEYSGMDLRDYFAAHAPGDLCRTPHDNVEDGEKFIGRPYPDAVLDQAKWAMDVEAKLRYIYADAMLEMRARSL